MPELEFQITGVEPAAWSITPLLQFKLRITGAPQGEPVQGLILNVQIQIQPPQRAYSPAEKARLLELFGTPERWGQTLRNRLWTHATAMVGAFCGTTETNLPVPCSYDLNIASTKYFYALEQGEVSLLFLFSGSVFYAGPGGRLQVQRLSWNKECTYRIPVAVWRELIEKHYPNSAFVALPRESFERLYSYKREQGFATWEEAIDRLLKDQSLTNPPGAGQAATAQISEVFP